MPIHPSMPIPETLMEIEDFGNLCMGCMKDKGHLHICPACGYRPDDQRSPLVLPYQAILNNKFLVGRILGKPGGFGVTYLTWDLVLHAKVAVKEYLPREWVARDSNRMSITPHTRETHQEFAYGLKQFLREARTLGKFNHPNVVRVREFFEQNNTAYLAMDYYEGITLDEFLSRNQGKLGESQAMNIMLPILDGLREVHAQGFLHRDIKPANIYLTQRGTPILLDFGAARQALWGLTRTLSVVLTPGFAPFEQYQENQEFGPPLDIYAVGATLYYLTTGQKPPEATGRFRKDTLTPPDRLEPGLSQRFSQAVMRALALEPEQRPQSIEELRCLLLPPEPAWAPALPESATVTASGAIRLEPVVMRPRDESFAPPHGHSSAPRRHFKCSRCKTMNAIPQGSDPSRHACSRCGKTLTRRTPSRGVPLWLWGLLGSVLVVGGMLLTKRTERSPDSPRAPASVGNARFEESDAAGDETPAAVAVPSLSPPLAGRGPESGAAEETDIEPSADTTDAAEPPRPDYGPERFGRHRPRHAHLPPLHAIETCRNQSAGTDCVDKYGHRGACLQVGPSLACIPNEFPPPPESDRRFRDP